MSESPTCVVLELDVVERHVGGVGSVGEVGLAVEYHGSGHQSS